MTEPTAIFVLFSVVSIALGIAIGYPWGFSHATKQNQKQLNIRLNEYKNRN